MPAAFNALSKNDAGITDRVYLYGEFLDIADRNAKSTTPKKGRSSPAFEGQVFGNAASALKAAVKEREDRREEAHPAKNLHRQDSPHPTIAIAMETPEQFSQGLSRPFDKSSGGRGVLPAGLLHSTCISTLAARAAGGLRWAGPPRSVPGAAAFS